jgi:hypothetical protein
MSSAAVLSRPQIPIQFPDEELQMTFQVALVGNDGIVIGSDRKMASLPDLVGEEEGFTQTSTQSKFVTSDDRQLVCACSGGVTAWDIAKQIRNEYRAYSDETKWEEYLDGICKSKQMSPWRDRLLVARADMPTMVVWMKIGGRATLMDKVCSGAYLSASFFVSQFFDPAASVKSLTRLALRVWLRVDDS